VIVLGMWRSGTTLLKEMLDSHSELAIPLESYFLPSLWFRHRRRTDTERLLADTGRISLVRRWGIPADEVRRRLPSGAGFSDVVGTLYELYAESRGKTRFGDKTPSYMQHLEALEAAFPGAQYVHIIRDCRDVASAYVSMRQRPRLTDGFPRRLAGGACQWRLDVDNARRFGAALAPGRYLELRYEDLVANPEPRLREICAVLGLDFEPAMLDYHRHVDGSLDPKLHPNLVRPPTRGLRNWRKELKPETVERVEAIAGDLLTELGYERAFPSPSRVAKTRAAVAMAVARARLAVWRGAVAALSLTPAWRLRHALIRHRAARPRRPQLTKPV
jgi:hypothetical protein